MQNIIDVFSSTIYSAAQNNSPLSIQGGNSKCFYGNTNTDKQYDTLDVTPYQGIINYEPTELVITARAGTRLTDLEAALRQHNQMLAFEPPLFTKNATLGGCIASGLSGPRRASAGSVRDFVLGVRILDGQGRDLSFGGQVMKNVAGYDISRLMVGAMGTLGVILDVSLKVLPCIRTELTIQMPMKEKEAIEKMNTWAGQPMPISATCFHDDILTLRLSGTKSAVRATHAKLGGDILLPGAEFWQSVREQTHRFFQTEQPLWRLSIPSTTSHLSMPGQQLIEWNGALRWLVSDGNISETIIQKAASHASGHATLFRAQNKSFPVFQPLDSGLLKIHRALKQKFDPAGILNPGRLYPEF